MKFKLPDRVDYILDTLHKNNYEAYIVGGSVRDLLLGRTPKDYDITTNALPQQVKDCFPSENIIDTGLQHGTITLVLDSIPYEITTYRIDGEYEDNRRPSSVEYTTSLYKDCERRDFTINSMAYNHQDGLIDYFRGEKDLMRDTIRCVGDPNLRFQEDALRILRAIRLSSVLGFRIEHNTNIAIFHNVGLLKIISIERIQSEFNKILLTRYTFRTLRKYIEIFQYIIPMFPTSIPFDWTDDIYVNLALLFNGNNIEKIKEKLTYLKYDNLTIKNVCDIIRGGDSEYVIEFYTVNYMKYIVKEYGLELAFKIIKYKRANKFEHWGKLSLDLNDIIINNRCCTLKQLKINGNDLIPYFQGSGVGIILNEVLNLVIEDKLENDKDKLLDFIEDRVLDAMETTSLKEEIK